MCFLKRTIHFIMLKHRMRHCWLAAKDATVKIFKILAHGVSLEEVTEVTTKKMMSHVPSDWQRPCEYLMAFILLHIYLLYVLVYSGAKFVVDNTKVKGKKIVPYLPDIQGVREKIAVGVLSFVAAFQFLHIASPFTWFGWAISLRPQINIKPQVKVVSSELCNSICHDPTHTSSSTSKISVSLQSVKPGLSYGIEPQDKVLRDLMKDVKMITDVSTTTKEVISAVVEPLHPSVSGVDSEVDVFEDAIDYSEAVDLIDFGTEPDMNNNNNHSILSNETHFDESMNVSIMDTMLTEMERKEITVVEQAEKENNEGDSESDI